MHPSPSALALMSTAELEAYRAELHEADLDAADRDDVFNAYRTRKQLVDAILADRKQAPLHEAETDGEVYFTITQNAIGEVVDAELFSGKPTFELPLGQTLRVGNINGGDSIQVAQNRHPRVNPESSTQNAFVQDWLSAWAKAHTVYGSGDWRAAAEAKIAADPEHAKQWELTPEREVADAQLFESLIELIQETYNYENHQEGN